MGKPSGACVALAGRAPVGTAKLPQAGTPYGVQLSVAGSNPAPAGSSTHRTAEESLSARSCSASCTECVPTEVTCGHCPAANVSVAAAPAASSCVRPGPSSAFGAGSLSAHVTASLPRADDITSHLQRSSRCASLLARSAACRLCQMAGAPARPAAAHGRRTWCCATYLPSVRLERHAHTRPVCLDIPQFVLLVCRCSSTWGGSPRTTWRQCTAQWSCSTVAAWRRRRWTATQLLRPQAMPGAGVNYKAAGAGTGFCMQGACGPSLASEDQC
jgi:hypothetical protein